MRDLARVELMCLALSCSDMNESKQVGFEDMDLAVAFAVPHWLPVFPVGLWAAPLRLPMNVSNRRGA